MANIWHSGARVALALAVVGSLAGACASTNSDSTPNGNIEAGSPTPDGSALEVARHPVSVFESGAPTTGEFCSALVAAECDGDEDCPHGQTCCGIVNGGALAYDSIKCQDTCEAAAGGNLLCHPGDPCPDAAGADASTAPVCRRSLILPPYLAICGAPSALLPTNFEGKPGAAHAINCGAELTCGDGTKCCVLGNWDAATQAITTRTGYCAPLDEECDCTKAPKGDGGD